MDYYSKCINLISSEYNISKEKLKEIIKNNFNSIIYFSNFNKELENLLWEKYNYHPVPFKKYINLFPHQIEAINFMSKREKIKDPSGIRGGILNLEMGMGKSLTSACFTYLRKGPDTGPTLIVCSKTILNEWKKQCFEKFFDLKRIKILYYHKDLIENFVKSKEEKYWPKHLKWECL